MEIEQLTQPTTSTCVHTCLAMVTGESIESLVERFGDRGLTDFDEALVLVENKLFPRETTGDKQEFPFIGTYLVSVPSLNIKGALHLVVVNVDNVGDTVLYDPNVGKEGKNVYSEDAIHTGEAATVTVVYVDEQILSQARYTKDG